MQSARDYFHCISPDFIKKNKNPWAFFFKVLLNISEVMF